MRVVIKGNPIYNGVVRDSAVPWIGGDPCGTR